jgi:hypothetical protein
MHYFGPNATSKNKGQGKAMGKSKKRRIKKTA